MILRQYIAFSTHSLLKKAFPALTLFVIAISFSLCRKSSDLSGLIIGKWNIDSLQNQYFSNGRNVYATFSKPTSDYFEFSKDSLFTYQNANNASYGYRIISLNGEPQIEISWLYTSAQSTQIASSPQYKIVTLSNRTLILIGPSGSGVKLFMTKR